MIRTALAICLLAAFPVSLAAQEAGPLVKIAPVQVQSGEQVRQFFGNVVAKETVDLAFQVGGQVMKLPIIEGQPLPQGALVAELDLRPFELALDQARVQLDQANRTLERLEKLQGSTVSQVTVDDAQTQAELARIAVENAERSLSDAKLTSPFDGLVASRNIAQFATVAAGTPVARLHDMSDLRVEIEVPEILFQRASSETQVKLMARFPSVDTPFELQIREFTAETSQVGQTFKITLGMAPPEGLTILPGSSVTVTATLFGDAGGAISVPGSAVVTANDGTATVMVFEPAGAAEGTVSRVPVEITPTATGDVAVTAGLQDGQEIVVSGANQLDDGAAVRRFTGFAN
ncbi:efflux RND transporter periplasmic adaptor subunit [Sulfitobacter sp. S190]|uniref:efflux RND transporter periplasmic adaptor subunit n=1 Tax=Sulfitobacter sp. S190 TaxID=2867022 RepID=UPI0021A663C4|nr:efflux RND transporter periplasmic adaptor subunit [Sulfitobacter sp. S190]UWR23591.1 efflux RND transporter periplasmic adaptor subunit [Sulfitobacter sp. S190]